MPKKTHKTIHPKKSISTCSAASNETVNIPSTNNNNNNNIKQFFLENDSDFQFSFTPNSIDKHITDGFVYSDSKSKHSNQKLDISRVSTPLFFNLNSFNNNKATPLIQNSTPTLPIQHMNLNFNLNKQYFKIQNSSDFNPKDLESPNFDSFLTYPPTISQPNSAISSSKFFNNLNNIINANNYVNPAFSGKINKSLINNKQNSNSNNTNNGSNLRSNNIGKSNYSNNNNNSNNNNSSNSSNNNNSNNNNNNDDDLHNNKNPISVTRLNQRSQLSPSQILSPHTLLRLSPHLTSPLANKSRNLENLENNFNLSTHMANSTSITNDDLNFFIHNSMNNDVNFNLAGFKNTITGPNTSSIGNNVELSINLADQLSTATPITKIEKLLIANSQMLSTSITDSEIKNFDNFLSQATDSDIWNNKSSDSLQPKVLRFNENTNGNYNDDDDDDDDSENENGDSNNIHNNISSSNHANYYIQNSEQFKRCQDIIEKPSAQNTFHIQSLMTSTPSKSNFSQKQNNNNRKKNKTKQRQKSNKKEMKKSSSVTVELELPNGQINRNINSSFEQSIQNHNSNKDDDNVDDISETTIILSSANNSLARVTLPPEIKMSDISPTPRSNINKNNINFSVKNDLNTHSNNTNSINININNKNNINNPTQINVPTMGTFSATNSLPRSASQLLPLSSNKKTSFKSKNSLKKCFSTNDSIGMDSNKNKKGGVFINLTTKKMKDMQDLKFSKSYYNYNNYTPTFQTSKTSLMNLNSKSTNNTQNNTQNNNIPNGPQYIPLKDSTNNLYKNNSNYSKTRTPSPTKQKFEQPAFKKQKLSKGKENENF